MQIVNGYVCQNCTDVANAKKYIDPAHPDQTPAKAQDDATGKSNQTAQAVTFGGSLSDPGTARNGAAAPKSGAPGSAVDISV